MMNVKLRFRSLFELWEFKETVQAGRVKVLSEEQVLLGDFDEAEVELAKNGYKAEMVNVEMNTRNHCT
jgi:hypothetical protein